MSDSKRLRSNHYLVLKPRELIPLLDDGEINGVFSFRNSWKYDNKLMQFYINFNDRNRGNATVSRFLDEDVDDERACCSDEFDPSEFTFVWTENVPYSAADSGFTIILRALAKAFDDGDNSETQLL